MKKLTAIILALLILTFVSCSGEETTSSLSDVSTQGSTDSDTEAQKEPLKWTGFTIDDKDNEFSKGLKTALNNLIDAKSFEFEMTLTQETHMEDIIQIEGEYNPEDTDTISIKTSSGTAEYDFDTMSFKLSTASSEGDAVVFFENGEGYSAARENTDTDWDVEYFKNDGSDGDTLSFNEYIEELGELSFETIIPVLADMLGLDLDSADNEKLEAGLKRISDILGDDEKNSTYITSEITTQDEGTVYSVKLYGQALLELIKKELQGAFTTEEAQTNFTSSIDLYILMFEGFELSANVSIDENGLPVSAGILLNVPSMMKMDMALTIKNIGNAKFTPTDLPF